LWQAAHSIRLPASYAVSVEAGQGIAGAHSVEVGSNLSSSITQFVSTYG